MTITVKELINKLSIVAEDSQISFSFNTDKQSRDIDFWKVDKINEHHVEIMLEE